MGKKARKAVAIKRPNIDSLVRDPDLRMSLDQFRVLAEYSAEQREAVFAPIIAPKFKALLELESIGNSKTILEYEGKIISLLCEHLFLVTALPIVGEKASIKAFLKRFQRLAVSLHDHIDEGNSWNLIWALAPATDWQTALVQTYNLNMALQQGLEASHAALNILNLNQLSTFENGKQKLAWSLAEIMDLAGDEIRSTSTGLFGSLLRVCLCTLFGVVGDDMLDTSRLAKHVLRKRRDGV